MRHYLLAFIWCFLSTMLGFKTMASEIVFSAQLGAKIRALIDDKKAVTELAGLQFVLIDQGKIIHAQAEGMAHISRTGDRVPLTIEHRVRVASISKLVMSLGFMQLVEQGKVELDVDVSDYLGFKLRNPNFPEQPITARQLLSHTSSIRDAGQYFLPLGETFKSLFIPGGKHYNEGAHFASAESQAPGAYFSYANLNFGILSGILERVSGQRFDRYLERNLFQPLGLEISFNSCRYANPDHSNVATLYRRGMGGDVWAPEGPWQAQVDDTERHCYYGGPAVSSEQAHTLDELDDYVLGSNPTLFSPQGGLRASAMDLARIVRLLLGQDDIRSSTEALILSRSTIEQMLSPVWRYQEDIGNGHTGGEANPADISSQGLKKSYGLSVHISDFNDWGFTQQSSVWYGHMASAYGLQGQLWFNPEHQQGIVILLTGMGDAPGLAETKTPLEAVEAQVLEIALDALRVN